MSLYKVEIFKPDFSFRSSTQVQDITYEFDYLSLSNNKIKLQNIFAERGDYIRITKGVRKIFGVIKGVSDSDTVCIEYVNILSLFDVNVYADIITFINDSTTFIEQWLAENIQSLFVTNKDSLQNIHGMEIRVRSGTMGKKKLKYNSNIFNLYELITNILTQHAIMVDVDIDVQNKKILVEIGKRMEEEKHIEASLPNVKDKEIAVEKGDEAINKILIINEDNQSEQIAYYLLQDGTVSSEAEETDRISPVVFDSTFITISDDEVFTDKAYDEAVSTLIPEEYDNFISITINNDDELVKPDEWLIGQKAAIIHKGKVYHSILTGIKIKKRTTLMFGAVRKDFTKKLKRRMKNGR